ncbi:MAG: efflux RND transporter permease subunit [Myxococcales bacterium]|nr:efflux RND transporter permease subunit [Myxococcales bacterium]
MNLRQRLPELAWDRPVSVLMVFVACLVIGSVAYVRMPVQMMPSGFEPGWLWVWLPYPEASPVEVDERIVRPIEAQFGTVSGIRNLHSRASSGSAGFSVEFHQTADLDEAYNSVVDRLERSMPDLPEDVERYGVYRYNPNDEPVVWAGVSLPESLEDPYYLMTRVVQPVLERIPGVAAIDVWGVPRRGVWIDYDKERIYAHGVDLGSLQRRLNADNFQLSSGKLLDRGLVRHARSLSVIDTVEDLKRYPVTGDIVLEDIADVQMRSALSANIQRVNGQNAAAFAIRKESSANTVEVSNAVRAALAELEQDARTEGASFFVFFSQGDLIEDSVNTLANTALFGGLFAIAVLWLFLREWRMTLLIATSIPFSLLITVGVLYFTGRTLNLLSMMGLMLAVGMVVDNAIVVVETIYRRRADGAAPRSAAVRGTAEVNLAILLSTLTTMVVFLPVILMSENVNFSFFMGVLGMPVVYALGASLLVALLFAPLATRYIGKAQVKPDPAWLLWLSQRYRRVLEVSIRRRVDSVMALAAMGLLTVTIAMPGVQCTDSGEGNINDFTVRFTVPPQASIVERDEIVRAFEDTLQEHREEWGIRVYRSRLRGDSRGGRLWVYLDEDAPLARGEVMKAAEEAFPKDLPGVEATVGWDGGFEQANDQQVNLSVNGEDTELLNELASEVARRVRTVEGVLGVSLDVDSEGADEIRLVVDRDAVARYGVSATQVGMLVSYAMRGSSLPDILDGEKEIPVTSRFSLEDRSDLGALLAFDVWSPTLQQLIPLRTVTDVEMGKGPGQIRRLNRRTTTGVTLDLEDEVTPEDLWPRLDAALADMAFPRGYGWAKGDRFDRRGEEDAAMQMALLLSVTFVFLLIGILFESWVLPLAIVTTIPMAMMGATWGLYLSGTPMDSMAGVGMVILVGVVVNNGIVLVDLITQLRKQGHTRSDAILEAGQRRLRPILMTALTTIFGLAPMAMGDSSFVGIPYAPLGRTVISGLVASTVLTLLFVPFLYTVLDDLRAGASSWTSWVRRTG